MNINTTAMMKPFWLLAFAAVLLLPVGCVLQPYNGQVLQSRDSPTHFQGSTIVPNDVVKLQYLNPSSGEFETFATTRTVTDPVTVGGTIHFVWGETVTVPLYAWEYTGTDWVAKVRIFWPVANTALTSFEADASACFEKYNYQLLDVLNNCKSPDSPVITLRAPY